MNIPQTELVATVGGQEIFRAVLPPGDYVIGRDEGIPVRLPSEQVSRRHAQLSLSYFDWCIEDLGSFNGTWVSGRIICEPTLIFPQQEVSVGDVQLRLRRLRIEDPGSAVPPQTAAVLRFLPAEMLGERKYKIHGLIAIGGMGVVLEAEDGATRRRVAMKVMLNAKTPQDVARFIEEAQITAQLEHPNVVPVYDLGVNEQDKPYFTMKMVRGSSLRSILRALREVPAGREASPSLCALLAAFHQICDGMAFAHSKGVVHRDLKPDNIMLGKFNETLVMDWGLAKPLGKSAQPDDSNPRTMVTSLRNEHQAIETIIGTSLGTPSYTSPEQACGRSNAVDGRSDVYSLGAMLYHIITLHPPVTGGSSHQILQWVAEGRITPFEEALANHQPAHLPGGKLPRGLADCALKAMALDPADRYASVKELQAEVHRHATALEKAGRYSLHRLFGV
jgi:serine/threonine protein kinase